MPPVYIEKRDAQAEDLCDKATALVSKARQLEDSDVITRLTAQQVDGESQITVQTIEDEITLTSNWLGHLRAHLDTGTSGGKNTIDDCIYQLSASIESLNLLLSLYVAREPQAGNATDSSEQVTEDCLRAADLADEAMENTSSFRYSESGLKSAMEAASLDSSDVIKGLALYEDALGPELRRAWARVEKGRQSLAIAARFLEGEDFELKRHPFANNDSEPTALTLESIEELSDNVVATVAHLAELYSEALALADPSNDLYLAEEPDDSLGEEE